MFERSNIAYVKSSKEGGKNIMLTHIQGQRYQKGLRHRQFRPKQDTYRNTHTGIVADKRYHDTSISQLLLDVGKIYWVWEPSGNWPRASSIFVFWLNKDNGASVGL